LERGFLNDKGRSESSHATERGFSDEEALSTFRQAVGGDPGEADFHFILGEAEARRGHLQEAVACYREAIRLDPQGPRYSHALGLALLQMGLPAEAAAAFGEETKLDPRNAESHHCLGNALVGAGQRDDALAALRRALALDPSSSPIALDLARALLEAKRAPEAASVLRRAMENAPDDVELPLQLARTLLAVGRESEALTLIDRAWHRDPRCLLRHPDLRAVHDEAAADALRAELALDAPAADGLSGISPWPLVAAAVHAVARLVARIPKLAVLAFVLAAGYAAARLVPPVVARYQLEDDLAAIAHDPVSDDGAIRERIASALERHGLRELLRADDCRVDTRTTWRRVVCTYSQPVTLLPGVTQHLAFRIDVDKPIVDDKRTAH
jgi:tetratricopeptide (TPR) repeat protein